MRFPILFSALAASTCLASCMDDVTDDQLGTDEHALTQLSDFGYGRMAALGGRPTYVVRVDYPGIANSPVTLTKTAATNLFYGDPQNPATPSVDGYYREMSNGLFWLVPKADEYISTLAPNSDPRVERLQIKAELFRRHPEIANLDTNQDGMVGRGEIAIFVIDNRGNTGQSDGGDDCVTQPGVTVKLCAPVARAGMQANLATIAHEGIHVNAGNLGAHDLYGAKMGLNNQNLSLMGPTWGGLFHLDPYTKLALGWIQPTVVSLRSGGSATVMPPTATTTQPEAVLLWDPSRGPDEYYLAEFRRPDANTYDRNTAAAGLGVWHVALDPTSKRNAVGAPQRPRLGDPAGYVQLEHRRERAGDDRSRWRARGHGGRHPVELDVAGLSGRRVESGQAVHVHADRGQRRPGPGRHHWRREGRVQPARGAWRRRRLRLRDVAGERHLRRHGVLAGRDADPRAALARRQRGRHPAVGDRARQHQHQHHLVDPDPAAERVRAVRHHRAQRQHDRPDRGRHRRAPGRVRARRAVAPAPPLVRERRLVAVVPARRGDDQLGALGGPGQRPADGVRAPR
jgi:M6 family metalloprotease-like protein